MTNLDSVAEESGIKVNLEKTIVLQILKKVENDIIIVLKNQVLQKVDHFKYLGSEITTDGRSNLEMRKRFAIRKAAFNKSKNYFLSALAYGNRKGL